MKEYKVLTEKDDRFTGRFNAKSLEATLNSYAVEGWQIVNNSIAMNSWKGSNAQITIILDRDHQ